MNQQTGQNSDDSDVNEIERRANTDRGTARIEFRQKHGTDYCCKCNKRLGPTDPLDYVCADCHSY